MVTLLTYSTLVCMKLFTDTKCAYTANQNRYEGKWMSDKKHGPGVFYYVTRGQRYDGEWVNDTPKCGSLSEISSSLVSNPAAPLPKVFTLFY